jgi:hypothetical protein
MMKTTEQKTNKTKINKTMMKTIKTNKTTRIISANALGLIILLVIETVMTSGCSKTKYYKSPCAWCGTENPLEDFKWLNQIVESNVGSLNGLEIYICTYEQDKQGFLVDFCPSCDDGCQQLMDCSGNTIGTLGGIAGTPYSRYNIDPESIQLFYKK